MELDVISHEDLKTRFKNMTAINSPKTALFFRKELLVLGVFPEFENKSRAYINAAQNFSHSVIL